MVPSPPFATPTPAGLAAGRYAKAAASLPGPPSDPAQAAGQPGGGGLSLRLPDGPAGAALMVAIAALPLLLGIGLLSLGRMWGEARSLRSAGLRLALASELDLKPRELAALSPSGLMKLRDEVAFDELTGVLRRVAGIASLERELARARRSRTPLSAVFVDLDGLKRVNDSKGHAAGDALIRGVAQRLVEGLRREDLVFRYGGDEFVCALPGVGQEGAEEKFRELRTRAAAAGLSFSFGIAELQQDDDLVQFLGRADERLYRERGKRDLELTGGQVVPMPAPRRRRSQHREPPPATPT